MRCACADARTASAPSGTTPESFPSWPCFSKGRSAAKAPDVDVFCLRLFKVSVSALRMFSPGDDATKSSADAGLPTASCGFSGEHRPSPPIAAGAELVRGGPPSGATLAFLLNMPPIAMCIGGGSDGWTPPDVTSGQWCVPKRVTSVEPKLGQSHFSLFELYFSAYKSLDFINTTKKKMHKILPLLWMEKSADETAKSTKNINPSLTVYFWAQMA